MMILVDGKQAMIKEGTSFEYRSENPLFTDAEDYTLEIEFPLSDSPQNVVIFGALHEKGVLEGEETYTCEIISGEVRKSGFLKLVEVNETGIKCQFLEGMSTRKLESDAMQVYIDEIDYSAYDGTDGTATSRNRVLGTGWDNLTVWDTEKDSYYYEMEGYLETRHIYLYKLIQVICEICGISLDLGQLNTLPVFKKVIIVNSTYSVAGAQISDLSYRSFMNLEKTLPHWTVKQLCDEVGKFFRCLVYYDMEMNSIRFERYEKYGKNSQMNQTIELSVIKDFSVEISEGEEDYNSREKVKLPDECNPDSINMCPEFIANLDKVYQVELIQEYFNPEGAAVEGRRNYNQDVLYLWNNLPVMITDIEERTDFSSQGSEVTLQFIRTEVINQYGGASEGDELKIVPCKLAYHNFKYRRDNKWWGIGSDGKAVQTENPYVTAFWYPEIEVQGVVIPEYALNVYKAWDLLKNTGDLENHYDKIYIAIHNGTHEYDGRHLNTKEYEPIAYRSYAAETVTNTEGDVPVYHRGFRHYNYTLSPSAPAIQSSLRLPKVRDDLLYRFKFISKSIPDPKAIFVIQGKEYACLRITAHFTVDGMSELLEGEFYEVID